MLHGLGVAALPDEHVRQIVVRLGIPRFKAQRFAVGVRHLVEAALAGQRLGQIEPRFRS